MNHYCRLRIFSDCQVVIGTILKEKNHSYGLKLVCRKLAAIVATGNVKFGIVYVISELNHQMAQVDIFILSWLQISKPTAREYNLDLQRFINW